MNAMDLVAGNDWSNRILGSVAPRRSSWASAKRALRVAGAEDVRREETSAQVCGVCGRVLHGGFTPPASASRQLPLASFPGRSAATAYGLICTFLTQPDLTHVSIGLGSSVVHAQLTV